MKNKINGFTLVELLAVIVILAIILLVAVPNVLGVIEEAREEAFIASAKMIIKTAEYEELTRTEAGAHDVDLANLDYDGTRYEIGSMNINDSGNVSAYLWSEELEICIFKDYDSSEVVIGDTKDELTCNNNPVETLTIVSVVPLYDGSCYNVNWVPITYNNYTQGSVTLSDGSTLIVDLEWEKGPNEAPEYINLLGKIINLPDTVTNPLDLKIPLSGFLC